MTTATPYPPTVRRWWPQDLIVTRYVRLPYPQLAARLRRPGTLPERQVLPDGELCLLSKIRPAPLARGWRSRGRFKQRGLRLQPLPTIEIEITPWSDRASELRIIPQSRFAHRWGVRRERRYARLANATADWLVSLTTVQAPAPARRHTSEPSPALTRRAG